MSATDVLDRYGTRALLRLFAALALYLLLHAVRAPFHITALLLAVGMRRIDGYLTAGVSLAGGPTRKDRQ